MAPITVGITGVAGFIGSHLRNRLSREKDVIVPPFEDGFFERPERMREFLRGCDAVVHLAAMNRGRPEEIYTTNINLVKRLIGFLEEIQARPHVLFSSSTQWELDNPYGRSKRESADLLREWANRSKAPLSVMVIPNVFGDRGRPHYNSVIATFCHQLAHGEEPRIIQDNQISLIYVHELTEVIWNRIQAPPLGAEAVAVQPTMRIAVSEILARLRYFRECYLENDVVPRLADAFDQNLYRTFLSYLQSSEYERRPKVHPDARGYLFEFVKREGDGQVFFSSTRPGVVRGNHYHTRKLEKFCVVRGEGIIRLRRIGTHAIQEYRVSGASPSVIEIPIFHTHNIENVGPADMLTLFWTSELYDPTDPDTYFEAVEIEAH
jgi:UDP-2-acetamido-2,6-beta-L-arabino-hexul-4-ose reductase